MSLINACKLVQNAMHSQTHTVGDGTFVRLNSGFIAHLSNPTKEEGDVEVLQQRVQKQRAAGDPCPSSILANPTAAATITFECQVEPQQQGKKEKGRTSNVSLTMSRLTRS